MYVLTVDRDADVVVQCVARIHLPKPEALGGERAGAFPALFRAATELWGALPLESAFVSLEIHPSAAATVTYSLVGPRSAEQRLRLALAAFMRLDGLADATVVVPESGEHFECAFVDPEALRLGLDHGPYATSGDGSVVFDASLFDVLPDATAVAVALGVGFRYECAVAPAQPAVSVLRQTLKSIAHLNSSTAAPESLAAAQRTFGERLAAAAYHAVEAVVLERDATGWLDDALNRVWSDTGYGRAGLAPTLVALAEADALALAYGTHPLVMEPEAGARSIEVSGYLRTEDVDARLRCTPLWESVGVDLDDVPRYVAPSPEIRLRPGDAEPVKDGRPFLFFSYARKNRALADQLIHLLERLGVSVWLDDRLLAGEEWDARLEQEILDCAGVVACLTEAYVSSKYCRRELKFADALDKPLIAVKFDDAPLDSGLAFLFASLQHLDWQAPDLESRLLASLESRAPGVVVSPGP